MMDQDTIMATKCTDPNQVGRWIRPAPDHLYLENDMSLVDRFGMDEEEQRRFKAFVEIDEADAENLRSLRDVFRDFSQVFAERFYQHLLAHPRTASLLQDPQQLQELKKIQAGYFSELLEAVLNDSYFVSRLRVG